MNDIIAIVGPTAVGKSAVADALAAHIGGAVVSADAMQVYRGMDIGTAKALPCECHAPLLLVDIVEPSVPYSAALYQRDARDAIDTLNAAGTPVVLCGGTGLYVRAALDAMQFPGGSQETPERMRYDELARTQGPEALYALLSSRDPDSAAVIHPHNVRRVIRALEMHDNGSSYARQKQAFSAPQPYYRASYYGLTMDRARLYARIDARVDAMMANGLLEEVQGLCAQGLKGVLTARQAIGYKEIIDYLDGGITLGEAIELIKRRSRRYAKRQISWFKRDERITWIDLDHRGIDDAVRFILDHEGELHG